MPRINWSSENSEGVFWTNTNSALPQNETPTLETTDSKKSFGVQRVITGMAVSAIASPVGWVETRNSLLAWLMAEICEKLVISHNAK